MKKVDDLSELINLVGKDTADRCFTEYMMMVIAKAQKLDDLQNYIEPLAKISNGEMTVKSGDLMTMLEAPLSVNIDEE